MNKKKPIESQPVRKRMALYARVSTEEQTKGNYPSCESQIEELEAECIRRGWDAYRIIKDEGFTAASLKRPGLTEMRWMVQSDEIDGVICTWYDRLTRSRDFYTLDNEFQAHGVGFITLHDPADTRTAAGRFMECMIVAAKTYERDQTSEKVRIKMRMRQEKGLHQGGLVPFGFTCDAITKLLSPDPEKAGTVEQIFRTYVQTRSDHAVRDWLKAHHILSPRNEAAWRVSTLRDLLCNRRYIGQIEINRKNKGVLDLPESEQSRTIPAPHGPLLPVDLFELAQAIRGEKRLDSPNRGGRGRSYSQNKCERVYPLQGRMVCAICGHAMTPYYIVHKPGQGRRKESFVHYYICSRQQAHGRSNCGHTNRVLARVSESWVLDRVSGLVCSDEVVQNAFAAARDKCERNQQPQHEALQFTRRALEENQEQIDRLVGTITSGAVSGDLMIILGEKATELRIERERLKAEQRQLQDALVPTEKIFDAAPLLETLTDFSRVLQVAQPVQMQRLLQLMVRRIEWQPEGEHAMEFYALKRTKRNSEELRFDGANDWLESLQRSDGPDRVRTGDLLRDRQAC